jgi:hypothetical protein
MKANKVRSWMCLFIVGAFFPVGASVAGDSLEVGGKAILDAQNAGAPMETAASEPLLNGAEQEFTFSPGDRHVEIRNFKYPAGYMHREPVINCPDLAMFHYGSAIALPDAGSLKKRAAMRNYWHSTNPDDAKQENGKK